MQELFLTFGFSGLSKKTQDLASMFLALLLAILILIFFDSKTLFLATLLVSIVSIKMINSYINSNQDEKKILIDKLVGVWFALSVAPSTGVQLDKILLISNGFLIQAITSFLLFIYFYTKKPSIIGRLNRSKKSGVNIVGDDVIAGFAAGICSSIIWQGISVSL